MRELTKDCRPNAYCLATLVDAYVLQNGQVVPEQIELSEPRYDVASMITVLAQRFQSSEALASMVTKTKGGPFQRQNCNRIGNAATTHNYSAHYLIVHSLNGLEKAARSVGRLGTRGCSSNHAPQACVVFLRRLYTRLGKSHTPPSVCCEVRSGASSN